MYLENQLTQIFTFTGTRLHHFSGNSVHLKIKFPAYTVCSNNQHPESELNHLRKVFDNFNSYPHWFITKVIIDVKNDFNKQIVTPTPHIETTDSENNKIGSQ